MKVIATAVAITLLTLTGLMGPGPMAHATTQQPTQTAPAPAPGGPLRIDLAEMTPRMVTAGGPGSLTLTGTITNTSDDPMSDVVVRVQRGDPIDSEAELQDALDGNAPADEITPQFADVAPEFAPGASLPLNITVPLRGKPLTSLAIDEPGVYDVLVNINGERDGRARNRLGAVSLLLPVLSLPPDPDRPTDTRAAVTAGDGTPFTMLLPVTAAPTRLPTVPGEPVLLADDSAAADLAPGGRLGGLVATLAQQAPPGSRTRSALCLAIDPALVETAFLMRGGYQVRGRDGVPVPGAGAEAAARWLDQLAAVARGGCVLALPYADADLVALTRGGMGGLAGNTITEGRRVVQEVLQVPVVPDAVWPADGAIDDATLDVVATSTGNRSVVMSAEAVEQGRVGRDSGMRPIAGGPDRFALLADPLLTDATTPATDTDPALRNRTGRQAAPLAATGALGTQNVIGAIALRSRPAADGGANGDGPLVLAPQHGWAPDASAVSALLTAMGGLFEAGQITGTPLDSALSAGLPPEADPIRLAYPVTAAGRETPAFVLDSIRATAAEIDHLAAAAVPDSQVGVSPDQTFTPLRTALARPDSAAWRGNPDAARAAATDLSDRVNALRDSVRVLEPPGPYSLGTSDAPILITLSNGLPVTMRVHVDIQTSAGLRVATIEPQEIPPLGRRQVRVSTQVTRSGQFSVQAAVRSPDGELLGPPSLLRVRSTAYGTITVWLTASAGILLVVLAVRRVVRRIRDARGSGEPSPQIPQPGAPPRPAGDPVPAASAPTPGPPPPPGPAPRVTGMPRQIPTTQRQGFFTSPDPYSTTVKLPAVHPDRDRRHPDR